jgi:hypothetical protein
MKLAAEHAVAVQAGCSRVRSDKSLRCLQILNVFHCDVLVAAESPYRRTFDLHGLPLAWRPFL